MAGVSPRTYDTRCEFCSGADRNADAAALVATEPRDLGCKVEWLDPARPGAVGVGDEMRRDDPGDLELDAIGVFGVPTFRGAVIACTDECPGIGEGLADQFELTECVDFPGEVIQPNRRLARWGVGCLVTNFEQSEVVIIR